MTAQFLHLDNVPAPDRTGLRLLKAAERGFGDIFSEYMVHAALGGQHIAGDALAEFVGCELEEAVQSDALGTDTERWDEAIRRVESGIELLVSVRNALRDARHGQD